MKTKIFFLLAALLLSVCTFAQSGNGTLKGDVNNDGTVDVADINAIIEIMKNGGGTGEETKYYFSIGTTPVTAENYTTVNGATTTIPTTMEYSATVRNYYYILIPSTKTMTIFDKASGATVNITEQTSAGINGHKLYKTNGALSVGGTAVITLSDGTGEETKYYFSIGTNAVTASNYTTVNNATTTIPTTTEYTSSQRTYHYILIPSNKTLTMVDKNLNLPIPMTEQTSAGINGHKLYKTNGAIASGATVVITLSDGTGEETKYYFSIGTEEVTASNYTTANNATTTIPTTMEYSATVRNYHYILIPSTKTMTITGKASGGSVNITEQTSAGISGHKLYKTNGALSVGGTVVITLSDGTGEETEDAWYYYAGWTLPTADNVETIINEKYPAESGSSVMNTAGKKTTSASSMDYSNNTLHNANNKATYYVLVPNGQTIVDPEDNSSLLSAFISQGTIMVGNKEHNVYKYDSTSRNINAIKIY